MNVAECSAGWSGQGQVIRKYHNYLTWHVVSRQDKTSRHVIFTWMFGTRPGEAIMIESLLMSLLVVNGDDEEGGSFQLVGWHRASLITDYGWWVSFIEAQNPLFRNYHYHWHHHFRPKMSSEKGFFGPQTESLQYSFIQNDQYHCHHPMYLYIVARQRVRGPLGEGRARRLLPRLHRQVVGPCSERHHYQSLSSRSELSSSTLSSSSSLSFQVHNLWAPAPLQELWEALLLVLLKIPGRDIAMTLLIMVMRVIMAMISITLVLVLVVRWW